GKSDPSNVADALTQISRTTVTLLNILNTEVDLAWSLVPEADLGYTVQRSTDGGQTWNDPGSVGARVPFFPDTDLSHRGYQYRVLAMASSGQTSVSINVVTADLSVGATGVDYSNGFPTPPTGLTLNGGVAHVVDPGWLLLTDGNGSEAATAFTNTRLGIST